MSINTMEYAAVFMQELDSQMVECATSGWDGRQCWTGTVQRRRGSEDSQNGTERSGEL